MFLKRHLRRKDGKEHVYYSLTESIRISRTRTVQRRVLNLGELNTTQLEDWQRSIEVLEETAKHDNADYSPIAKGTLRLPRMSVKCSYPLCGCAALVNSGHLGWGAGSFRSWSWTGSLGKH